MMYLKNLNGVMKNLDDGVKNMGDGVKNMDGEVENMVGVIKVRGTPCIIFDCGKGNGSRIYFYEVLCMVDWGKV